jgi:RNA polymerase sigma-70 factor (ECF subfamily)
MRRDALRRKLESALGTLTELQRQVVLLHDLEGMAHKEVAELLDISEVSSRQHLFVARRLLRERLGTSTIEEYAHD